MSLLGAAPQPTAFAFFSGRGWATDDMAVIDFITGFRMFFFSLGVRQFWIKLSAVVLLNRKQL